MPIQRVPGADGRTIIFSGTKEEAEAYARQLATHPDPDNTGENDE